MTIKSGAGAIVSQIIRTLCTLLVLFISIYPAIAFENNDCIDCHGETDLVTEDDRGVEIFLYINPATYDSSAHGDFNCIDCHQGIDDIPHADTLPQVDCGQCHDQEQETYKRHGRLYVGFDPDIPGCADCHGKHDIFHSSSNKSKVNPLNLPQTCGKCHEDIDIIKKHDILVAKPIEVYTISVHGKAASGGLTMAATCNDCHSSDNTAHKIFSPDSKESSINHFNIPYTCGKCHTNIANDYWEGIHGELVKRGETDSPVCTDCHGEHGILSPEDPRSPVSPTRVAEATCSPCHESARLNEKYDIPTGRLKTWVDSYHGLKSRAGDITVANCASCHGAHKILPHTNPASSINKANLQETCGNCHPGISATIANTPIHGTPGMSSTPVANIIAKIYIVSIILIIGTMVFHWLIDLRRQISNVMKKKQVKRMRPGEVWQHALLTVSFIVLVITGFSLRFAEAGWVKMLFGWEGGFPLRGIIHRVAAVLFILTVIWHVIYLITAPGRKFFFDIFPSLKDFKQFWEMVKYNLGFSSKKPDFARFSYVEKAEYWALVWGSVIMIVSGFFLWFDNIAVKWFPKGFLDTMLVVHYYEAWLATLAILIWHMYSTIFNPAVYPMNPSWITGNMPEDMFKHEHAAADANEPDKKIPSAGSMKNSDNDEEKPE
jgi:cytochrome b subunit of formate dehydrogenase